MLVYDGFDSMDGHAVSDDDIETMKVVNGDSISRRFSFLDEVRGYFRFWDSQKRDFVGILCEYMPNLSVEVPTWKVKMDFINTTFFLRVKEGRLLFVEDEAGEAVLVHAGRGNSFYCGDRLFSLPEDFPLHLESYALSRRSSL